MNTFFASDTHFSHQRICEFEPVFRPFSSMDEHNEILIKNWNSVVLPTDFVWHLGDVIFGGEPNYNLVKRLNGRKGVVLGNHDTPKKVHDFVTQGLFDKVVGCVDFDRFILSHIPVHTSQLESRFKANIHGHVHSKPAKSLADDPRYFNVSMEAINLTPIALEDIYKVLRKRGVL